LLKILFANVVKEEFDKVEWMALTGPDHLIAKQDTQKSRNSDFHGFGEYYFLIFDFKDVTLKGVTFFKCSKKVTIGNIIAACWLENISVPQDYIVPVYAFSGRCFDNNGKLMEDKFNWWVEAVK
jgi:hypothetical protein